jgi:hypothetical protein
MKNTIRAIIILIVLINACYKFSPETYTIPITYDGTLPTMHVGKIGVVKPNPQMQNDTLDIK